MNGLTFIERCRAFKQKFGIGRKAFVGHALKAQGATRSYPGGSMSRLTADWFPSTATGDSEIRYDICSLRDRSRQLERADPLMRKYLNTGEKNVLRTGVGFALQNKSVNLDGTLALLSNRTIERDWKEWCKPKNCTVSGDASFYEVCRLVLRSTMRDGGILVRKIIDPNINEFGFALQLLEIDHLDIQYNVAPQNGYRIIMGVEKDPYYKTVAYHILREHPGDMLFGARSGDRVRVSARDIIHYFVKERVTQCIGVPWAAPSFLRMHHLEQYEIAELVASRAAANKGGYFTSERGDQWAGQAEETITETGTQRTGTFNDSEPGQYDELPAGMSFQPYDPTHPTNQYPDFVNSAKLGIVAGMDMSYPTIVGDLTRASFSSMRTGMIDERESFKKMQAHEIEHLAEPVFEAWLETGITAGAIKLPISKFRQLNAPHFMGRKFDWIDPEKDVRAKLLEVAAGLRPLSSVIDQSDSDLDLEQTFAEIKRIQDMADQLGLRLQISEVSTEAQAESTKPEPFEGDGEQQGEEEFAMNGNGNGRLKKSL